MTVLLNGTPATEQQVIDLATREVPHTFYRRRLNFNLAVLYLRDLGHTVHPMTMGD